MAATCMESGIVSAGSRWRMTQSSSSTASFSSVSVRGGRGTTLSLIQVGRRGYVPVVRTSIAGARLKLGDLIIKGEGRGRECHDDQVEQNDKL